MMNRILTGWNFMRGVRLVLGFFIIAQGVQAKDIMFVLLGALFTAMPLLNIGCCGASGCNVSSSRSGKETEDITYEEVR